MRKQLLVLLAASTLALGSVSASATDLAREMTVLGSSLQVIQKTDKADEMKEALNRMRAAALEAQKAIPPKLEGAAPDSAEMQDYRHGFDVLVGQIDNALQRVSEGKMQEARAAAEAFKATRNSWHQKYR